MCRVQDGTCQPVDVGGVAPQDQGCHDGVECCPGRCDGGVAERLTPSNQAIFSFDLDQQDLKVIPELPGKAGMRPAHGKGQ